MHFLKKGGNRNFKMKLILLNNLGNNFIQKKNPPFMPLRIFFENDFFKKHPYFIFEKKKKNDVT